MPMHQDGKSAKLNIRRELAFKKEELLQKPQSLNLTEVKNDKIIYS